MGEQVATEQDVRAVAARAREAAAELAPAAAPCKDAALRRWPTRSTTPPDAVLARECEATSPPAARPGLAAALVDRLALDAERVAGMAQGLRDVAALPDPVGEVLRGYTQPNGLEIRQLRVPFGVIAMIYEARPNVTVDAAGLALKSGNAALLRGSASAYESNCALVDVLAGAAEKAGLPRDSVQLVPGTDRPRRAHLLGPAGSSTWSSRAAGPG